MYLRGIGYEKTGYYMPRMLVNPMYRPSVYEKLKKSIALDKKKQGAALYLIIAVINAQLDAGSVNENDWTCPGSRFVSFKMCSFF